MEHISRIIGGGGEINDRLLGRAIASDVLEQIPPGLVRLTTSNYFIIVASANPLDSRLALATPSENRREEFEETIRRLAAKLDNSQDLVELLKDSFCLGLSREVVLNGLEERLASEGRQVSFGGDIWEYVPQIEELGFDVNLPPRMVKILSRTAIR